MIQDDFVYFEDGESEDAETMLVTGHFNPNQVTVDIDKVNPIILNNGKSDTIPTSYKNHLSKIEECLKGQEEMIKLMLSKMELLEKVNKQESEQKLDKLES
jgi:hypothetical protein